MEIRKLIARVCTILIPTGVSESVSNRQLISRIYLQTRPSTVGVKNTRPSPSVVRPYVNANTMYCFAAGTWVKPALRGCGGAYGNSRRVLPLCNSITFTDKGEKQPHTNNKDTEQRHFSKQR